MAFAATARAEGLAPQDTIDAAFALQKEGATLTQVREALAPHAGEPSIDFALGGVDFLLSGERLVQRCYRHGFLSTFHNIGWVTGGRSNFLLWIGNDNPEATTAADVQAAMVEWVEGLEAAEQTLAAIDGSFTCVLTVTDIRFDVNHDGTTSSAESLGALFRLFPPRTTWNRETNRSERTALVPEGLTIAFDTGDASWLRGYCHVLMGVGEMMLAHDGSDLFDHTGHVFFPKADISHDYLPGSTWSLERMAGGMQTPTPFDMTDLLAFIANMRLPVDQPQRMSAALEHFRAAVAHGKQMWRHYDQEQDNDREWVPNPDQTAAFHGVEITPDMRDAWLLFLDEADAILEGKKVLRFWRGDGTRGIDVPKVFEEPREFDLIYWIQGSAAAPYLREGEFTTPGTWAQLDRVFRGRVFRYSFWFN